MWRFLHTSRDFASAYCTDKKRDLFDKEAAHTAQVLPRKNLPLLNY